MGSTHIDRAWRQILIAAGAGAAIALVACVDAQGEEPIDSTACGGRENCQENQRCMTHELWEDLNATVYGFLRNVTLAQLVERQRTKTVAVVRTHPKAAHESQPLSA